MSPTIAIALALALGGAEPLSMAMRVQPADPPAPAAPPSEPAPAPAPAPAPSDPATTSSDPATPPSDPPPAAAPADPAPAPAESAPPSTSTAPADAGPANESDAGKPVLITGIAFTVTGGVALLLVAMPSAIVRAVALDRASRDPVIGASSREDRLERARVADDVMEGAFWTGIACLAIGLPLTIAGAVIRSKARDDVARRVDLDASGATIRF